MFYLRSAPCTWLETQLTGSIKSGKIAGVYMSLSEKPKLYILIFCFSYIRRIFYVNGANFNFNMAFNKDFSGYLSGQMWAILEFR